VTINFEFNGILTIITTCPLTEKGDSYIYFNSQTFLHEFNLVVMRLEQLHSDFRTDSDQDLIIYKLPYELISDYFSIVYTNLTKPQVNSTDA